MLIPVIGPSKAGKTETTRALVGSCSFQLERVDLDEELGSSHRGDGVKAVERMQHLATSIPADRHVLVDVGAGQLVCSSFASYLITYKDYPRSVVVIWCDEPTFRNRHGTNAPNEVSRYYGPKNSLTPLWENAASAGRLVDTSGAYAPKEWAQKLKLIVQQMILTGNQSRVGWRPDASGRHPPCPYRHVGLNKSSADTAKSEKDGP